MELNLNLLNEKIEYIRGILINLVSLKPLTDTEVVKCSQHLDKLLTEYESIKAYSSPNDAA